MAIKNDPHTSIPCLSDSDDDVMIDCTRHHGIQQLLYVWYLTH